MENPEKNPEPKHIRELSHALLTGNAVLTWYEHLAQSQKIIVEAIKNAMQAVKNSNRVMATRTQRGGSSFFNQHWLALAKTLKKLHQHAKNDERLTPLATRITETFDLNVLSLVISPIQPTEAVVEYLKPLTFPTITGKESIPDYRHTHTFLKSLVTTHNEITEDNGHQIDLKETSWGKNFPLFFRDVSPVQQWIAKVAVQEDGVFNPEYSPTFTWWLEGNEMDIHMKMQTQRDLLRSLMTHTLDWVGSVEPQPGESLFTAMNKGRVWARSRDYSCAFYDLLKNAETMMSSLEQCIRGVFSEGTLLEISKFMNVVNGWVPAVPNRPARAFSPMDMFCVLFGLIESHNNSCVKMSDHDYLLVSVLHAMQEGCDPAHYCAGYAYRQFLENMIVYGAEASGLPPQIAQRIAQTVRKEGFRWLEKRDSTSLDTPQLQKSPLFLKGYEAQKAETVIVPPVAALRQKKQKER